MRVFTGEIAAFKQHIEELSTLDEEMVRALILAIGHNEVFKRQFNAVVHNFSLIQYAD